MLQPGTIARASFCPGLRPPGPHPIIIVNRHANGLVGYAYISHSTDLALITVPIPDAVYQIARRAAGGPLTDQAGRILIADRDGRRIVLAEPLSPVRLRVGTVDIGLTHGVTMPSATWAPLRDAIRSAAGLPP